MRSYLLVAALSLPLLLSGCGDVADPESQSTDRPVADSNGADSMASNDPAPGAAAEGDTRNAKGWSLMQVQVVLERLGFGSGVVDGKAGISTTNAIRGFQESRSLTVTGELDETTLGALAQWDNIPATRVVTIPQDWSEYQFSPLPEHAQQQAGLELLGYETIAEKLAERFHTTPDVLARLNPLDRPASSSDTPQSASTGTSPGAVAYTPGQQVRVPNVGADRIEVSDIDNADWLQTLRSLGVGSQFPDAARIVVDESEGWLKVYDAADKLVALFTVTTGSSNDPLPIGEWGINGVAYNPPFAYDPELFWDVPDSVESQQLPPGPNGPVGVVWIDLTKEHYGIHGTPAPETIGRAQSHGCVRLTNWDAARLAGMVSGNTKVLFQR